MALRLVADDPTGVEMAALLFLSPRTVDPRRNSLNTKLGVASRSAATRFGVEHGLR